MFALEPRRLDLRLTFGMRHSRNWRNRGCLFLSRAYRSGRFVEKEQHGSIEPGRSKDGYVRIRAVNRSFRQVHRECREKGRKPVPLYTPRCFRVRHDVEVFGFPEVPRAGREPAGHSKKASREYARNEQGPAEAIRHTGDAANSRINCAAGASRLPGILRGKRTTGRTPLEKLPETR